MDLRGLRYFVTVVEAGSLTKAASLLFVAQPALTAQIKKLEDELGAQLLERSHVGVTPTSAGLQLYQDACRLLSDAAAMCERIRRSDDSPQGSVTIALPFLLASLLAGRLLLRVGQLYPRIRVFVLDDLSLMVQKAMLDGRADVGVLVDVERVRGLVCTPLATESMFVCGLDPSGDAARLATIDADGSAVMQFSRAATLPLVLQSRRFAIRQSVEAAAVSRGVTLNIAHEQDSARAIRSLYLAGGGFTFTPACAMADEPMRRGTWLRARVVEPEITRRYFLAAPAEREPSQATALVSALLQDEVRAVVEEGVWAARLPQSSV